MMEMGAWMRFFAGVYDADYYREIKFVTIDGSGGTLVVMIFRNLDQ